MAVAAYNTDLDDTGNTLTSAEESTGWDESSDTGWDDQGPPAYQDGDYAYIQGSYSVTADTTKTGVGTLIWAHGSTFTIPTDGAMLIWLNFYNPNALDTYANGGLRALIGSDMGTFWSWDVGGSDYGSYPYGGWQNFAVNDTVTPDDTVNSYAGGAHDHVGGGCKVLTGISKGESFQVDVIRKGRCTAEFTDGQAGSYCTISGFAAVNDATSARWGLIQAIPGGYLWKGHMSLGTSGTACYFTDSDVNIFIQDTPKVTANFNTIEILNASTEVNMTGFVFTCLDPSNTASKGRWITTNDATVNLTSCSFIDMSTFAFDAGTTAYGCTWKRCAQIDPAGGDLSFSNVLESSVTGGGSDGGGALLWNDSGDPNTKLNDMTFTKGAGSHHAIEFGTSAPQTINLTNMTFTDFSVSDQQTTSVLYFQDTGSDVTWNVAHTGTTGTISYYKERSGDTVNITSSVPITITVKDKDDTLISDVQTSVHLLNSPYTEIMNEDTVAGVASENYTGSTPVDVVVKARKSDDLDSPRYKPYSSTQVVAASGGLTLSIALDTETLPI